MNCATQQTISSHVVRDPRPRLAGFGSIACASGPAGATALMRAAQPASGGGDAW